jgi:glycosyltransferase involved in cell wall biosynthesis
MIYKRLKVAHIIKSLDRRIPYGVVTFLKTLIRCTDKEKVESFVIAYEFAENQPECEEFEACILSRFKDNGTQQESHMEMTQWLIQAIRNIQPDIAQTYLYLGDTIGRLAASRAQVPVIICRESNVHQFSTERHHAAKRRLAKITDRVVCISEAVKRYACEVENIPESLTTIIYNGLQLNEYLFQAIEPTNQFVYIGRLEPQKAPLNLLLAFTTIAAEYLDCQLTLIGDGSLRVDCQNYVQAVGLQKRIHFLGYHAKPWQYAPPGSIFVHCCDYEGFGTAITEAMACGHLCILPKVGGIPEVAENCSEAIFYEGDCDNLVAAMRCALEMPVSQKLQILKAARARVERDFDASRMTEQYLDLYQTLYAQNQSRCKSKPN